MQSDRHEACPVCLSPATLRGSRDYGDKKQFDCPRCGPFEISGTALAILSAREKLDSVARAKMSHAIRRQTSEGRPLQVYSTNVASLLDEPLPDVHQQIANLLQWLAAQLKANQSGAITLPKELGDLASIIGATDASGIQRLLRYAAMEKLVDLETYPDAALTKLGWAKIHIPNLEEAPSPPAVTPEPKGQGLPSVIVKAHCNRCGGDRDAFQHRLFEKVEKSEPYETGPGDFEEDEIWQKLEVLECAGCHDLSVRRTYSNSALDEIRQDSLTGDERLLRHEEVASWPAPARRKQPDWVARIDDENLARTLSEPYPALDADLRTLAAIGARTAVDRAAVICGAKEAGSFADKLAALTALGKIGREEEEILITLTDAGGASAHRGWAPKAAQVGPIMDTMEAFLYRTFVLKDQMAAIQKDVPSRPPKKQ